MTQSTGQFNIYDKQLIMHVHDRQFTGQLVIGKEKVEDKRWEGK
jgi:hypothetical protein